MAGRVLSLALLVLLVLPAQALAQVLDAPVIIAEYERARDQHNIDAALSHFADDAVVRLEERTAIAFTGKAEIRRFLEVVGIRTPPLVTSNRHVVGNTVTWSERDQGQLQAAIDLTVEAVVQEGKITSLIYRVAIPPRPAAPQADGPARLPAPIAATLILVLGSGLLALAALGSRRAISGSTMRGKLIASLAHYHPAP